MPAARLELLAAYGALLLAVGGAQRQYAPRVAIGLHDVVPRLLVQAALPLLALAPVAGRAEAEHLLALAFATLFALYVFRAVACALLRMLRVRGVLSERTLIVGAGHYGTVLADTLEKHPEYGLAPVGFLDEFDEPLTPPILGTPDDLELVLERHAVSRVIVAFGGAHESELIRVLRACDARRVEVYVVPRFFELGGAGESEIEHVWGFPLVRLRRPAFRRYVRPAKRAFDVLVAGTVLVLSAPLMALCAAVVKLSSPGPVLFRQKRVGLQGRIFEVFKFRTMHVNEDSDTKWNVDDDNRVTRVGSFLRTTSLDELPQLFNVLRGEMSIVGPRPERPYFVEHFEASIPHYGDRHRLPAGITGWAQVHNLRGNTSIEERARFDNAYIEQWSLWRDIVIVVRTVTMMLLGRR